MNKDMKAVLKAAEARGWTVTQRTGSGHLRLVKPGCRPVFAPSTPGEYRGIKNLESQIRRAERGDG